MKFLANMVWVVLAGIIVIIGFIMMVGSIFSPDTWQQSRLACSHAIEALTGELVAIKETGDGVAHDVYSGQLDNKDVVCKTSLLRRRIIKLSIGNENKLSNLESRDIRFNPTLDYFHDHEVK